MLCNKGGGGFTSQVLVQQHRTADFQAEARKQQQCRVGKLVAVSPEAFEGL